MTENISVLLIHHDKQQIDVISQLLDNVNDAPFQVEVAHSVVEGLQRLEQKKIDTVLLDLGLLQGQEVQLLKQIQTHHTHTAIVLLLESETDVARLKSVGANAQDYVNAQAMSPRLLEVTLRYALEHKQCQDMLRQTESRLQFIIESIQDFAIFSTDLDGHIDFWNNGAEHVFGYPETEIIGQHFEILFTAEDRAQGVPAKELHDAAQKGRAVDERWHLKKGATQFYASGMTRPIYDNIGTHIGFTKVARDLTERQVAQEQHDSMLQHALEGRTEAEQTNTLKEEFLALIAHELKTPLASIFGFASMITSKTMVWPREALLEYAAIIEEEAQRMSDLIEQLTDHARQQTGTLKINLECTSLDEIIRATMPQLRALTSQHGLLIDLPLALPRVHADPQRIGQVMTNLVGNAARYSQVQTRITIHAQHHENEVRIDVIDEGRGIPLDERDKVFNPFHQVEHSSRKGLGLGLALCKNLIERHNGKIWIQEYEGPGTMMSLTLPIAQDERGISSQPMRECNKRQAIRK
jgi:two-component system, chemotaxis family, CheB/CheR fusion protein